LLNVIEVIKSVVEIRGGNQQECTRRLLQEVWHLTISGIFDCKNVFCTYLVLFKQLNLMELVLACHQLDHFMWIALDWT